MSGVLTQLRARLRDFVKVVHPNFLDVDVHHGRLQADEVRRITAFSPACRVGIFGSIKSEYLPTAELKLLPRFAAVAMVKTGDLLESTDQAMELATALSGTVAAWCPGVRLMDDVGTEIAPAIVGVGLPEAITIEPALSAELQSEGIALWACLFTVPVAIGRNLSKEEAATVVELTGLEQYFPVDP